MGNLKNKLYRFMYGRYGTDTLGKVYLWTYIVVVLLYTVISLFLPTDAKWPQLLMLGYYAISLTLIVLIFSRYGNTRNPNIVYITVYVICGKKHKRSRHKRAPNDDEGKKNSDRNLKNFVSFRHKSTFSIKNSNKS